MALSYSQRHKLKQERAKKAREEKDKWVKATRDAVNTLLTRALRDDSYSHAERREISDAVRALDSVVGGWCNDRRR